MSDILLLKPGSNLMSRLTPISTNADKDRLTASIWVVQVTDIKRILTKPLYEKILEDFTPTPHLLTGDYLTIYDEYIVNMLVFYTAADFIQKNAIMISNGGNYKHTADNSQIPDYKETDRLVKHYRELGAHFELQFYEFMKTRNIPEYKRVDVDTDSLKFGWYFD